MVPFSLVPADYRHPAAGVRAGPPRRQAVGAPGSDPAIIFCSGRPATERPSTAGTEPTMAAKTASAAAKTATAAAKTAAAAVRKDKVRELTEEELLKAPEKDYMNEAQLAFFRKRLLELRDQLLQNADDTGEHLRENEVTTDPSDRATLEEEYTLELRTRDRERKLLKKVEKSLKQIDDGSYGWCDETGEPIGIPRLLARPTATLSLEAQERRERVQKLYGD
jgi:DnaK suppressor protein